MFNSRIANRNPTESNLMLQLRNPFYIFSRGQQNNMFVTAEESSIQYSEEKAYIIEHLKLTGRNLE